MLAPRAQVIESFGLYFEQYKLPRILGRVYGLLLITDQPYLGLDQMVAELEVSKGSVSTVVRQLAVFMMIEKVTRPGDRRDYYRVSPKAHLNYLQSSMQSALSFSALIETAAQLENLSPETQFKIGRIEHLYQALAQVLAEFFANYVRELDQERGE
jgi:DNA-binding transcriptional regulator GbsR (MarR family)